MWGYLWRGVGVRVDFRKIERIMSAFAPVILEVFVDAHDNFDDMDYDVNPCKDVMLGKIVRSFPGDGISALSMSRNRDCLCFRKKGGSGTTFFLVNIKTGKAYKVSPSGLQLLTLPDMTCDEILSNALKGDIIQFPAWDQ